MRTLSAVVTLAVLLGIDPGVIGDPIAAAQLGPMLPLYVVAIIAACGLAAGYCLGREHAERRGGAHRRETP